MSGMSLRAFLFLILAARPAAAEGGPASETAAALSALGADDECQTGFTERCGLNAVQLRRQRLAEEAVNQVGPQGPYEQCGGKEYNGTTECVEGYACFNDSEYFSLCKPKMHVIADWKKYNSSPALDTKSEAPLLTFYVYRAIDTGAYPPTNANLGSIGSILWWIHQEVITCKTCPNVRSYGIERIARYKLQTKAPPPLFATGMNFGLPMDFEDGQCKGPLDCDETFAMYGYYVGCKNISGDAYNPVYYSGAMYSLPGECSGLRREMKSMECKNGQPGGFCKGVPSGNGTCTWSYEEAGEVSLNELEGITNYTAFKEAGGEEYQMAFDKGVNMTFWDDLYDPKANAARVKKLDALFKKKFPDLPSDEELAIPPCDSDKKKFLPKDSPIGEAAP